MVGRTIAGKSFEDRPPQPFFAKLRAGLPIELLHEADSLKRCSQKNLRGFLGTLCNR